MIEVIIPKEVTFDLMEGNFSARIINVKPLMKQSGDGPQDWVRFLFAVRVPGMSHLTCMAGRNFKLDLNPGSELRNWLSGLLSSRFFKENSGKKIDLESLIGRECEIVLEHYQGAKFDKPMVIVAELYPPGSLKLTELQTEGGQD